jgi:hypothetical protein
MHRRKNRGESHRVRSRHRGLFRHRGTPLRWSTGCCSLVKYATLVAGVKPRLGVGLVRQGAPLLRASGRSLPCAVHRQSRRHSPLHQPQRIRCRDGPHCPPLPDGPSAPLQSGWVSQLGPSFSIALTQIRGDTKGRAHYERKRSTPPNAKCCDASNGGGPTSSSPPCPATPPKPAQVRPLTWPTRQGAGCGRRK